MATHLARIERLDALLRLIPAPGAAASPETGELLERTRTLYGEHRSNAARRRALERDLRELLEAEQIEVHPSEQRPRRYRRCRQPVDANVWEYVRRSVRELVERCVPLGRFDALWQRLLVAESDPGLGLGEHKLRVVGDSLRLQPAEIREPVLIDVLDALARSKTLKISYRSATGQLSYPTLHPQGLLQRGPRLYLYALKNHEPDWRMYAVHRIIRSEVGAEPARQLAGFDLQALIDEGAADFSVGKTIRLCIRVRGYVVELLRDCPLARGQRIDLEPDGSPFEARVEAELPSSGQLLRWLLGMGDNVEVLEPAELRQVMANQASRMATLYSSPA